MSAANRFPGMLSRRAVSIGVGLVLLRLASEARSEEAGTPAPTDRFDYLRTHGNSNCSGAFMASIATMPAVARLQGSCCSPMDRHRYIEQVQGLTKYSVISEIPPNPYDVVAGLAQTLMLSYDLALPPDEQRAYQYAMDNSEEQGPCCCRCWRWKVYGGLAKYLIRERRFTGEMVVEVWDLSDGCGGGNEHHHGWLQEGVVRPAP